MLDRAGCPLPSAAQIERHQEVEVVIAVRGEDEGSEAGGGHLYAELLGELADQAGLGRFARLQLAAGELPEAGQGLALRPLAHQHPAIDVHQGAGGHQEQPLAVLCLRSHAFD